MSTKPNPKKKIMSRQQAQANGFKLYFTGAPCKHGHITWRRVDNWGCVECQNQRNREHMNRRYRDDAKFRRSQLLKQKIQYSNIKLRKST